MRERIVQRILQARAPHGPLPSIRSLARDLGASPQTVQKAMAQLVSRGEIHVLDRKGAFWGPKVDDSAPRNGQADLDGRERLGTDLLRGVFHPSKPLPARKELAVLYGVSPRRIGQFLEERLAAGALVRRGRSYLLPPPASSSGLGSVLVVVRCDSIGRILLETEREIDFLKSVRREASERNLRVQVVGFHETSQGLEFLDAAGERIDPKALRGVPIGVIASTWLAHDPHLLLAKLRRLSLPISVWWEHAPEEFRPPRKSNPPMAGFNLSFGSGPGEAVGNRLAQEGCRQVAWVSPYHHNGWSRERLAGLRRALAPSGATVHPFVADAFHSRWHMDQVGKGAAGGERLLREVLSGFLSDPGLRKLPVWVVVNDMAAVCLLDLLAEQGMDRPRIISFDATSASESYRFDSFEFHTEGMVRRMLHHLFHPTALSGERELVQEMVGRLVLRT